MADLDDATILDEAPDLSDVVLITVNVETRDGGQYSFLMGLEDEAQQMSLLLTTAEQDALEIRGDDHVIRTLPATQTHTIEITRKG